MTARRTRAMKVRWPRRVACGHYVITGQTIIQRDGKWACLECALAAIQATAAEVAAAEQEEKL